MNTVAIIFAVLIIISIPLLMVIVGASLLGTMKFSKYKTKKSCEKALTNMKKNLKNNDNCPAWDGVECRNGIYNTTSGKCSTKTKSNIGRLLIILGCFIVLPLAIIIIMIILFTQHKSMSLSMSQSITPSMSPYMSPSMSPSMSAGMTPYY
jgi:hypothetical protein